MPKDDKEIELEKATKSLDIAADVRKFEITLYWQRSLFFWGFIGAAFVAYAALRNKDIKDLAYYVSCFGVVCSFAWALINRGSKYWQEAWEQKVERAERAYGIDLFEPVEKTKTNGYAWRARRFSVSRISIALSDFTFLIWVSIAFASAPEFTKAAWTYPYIVVTAASAIYIVSMFVGGKSNLGPDRPDDKPETASVKPTHEV